MSHFIATDPTSYRFWVEETVQRDDIDRLGHVNNKAYVAYYETARIAYGAELGLFRQSNLATAIVRLEIDYLREVRYPAALRVGVRMLTIGNTSLTLASAVFKGEDCVSTSKAVLVRFDIGARASTPFTDAERTALEREL